MVAFIIGTLVIMALFILSIEANVVNDRVKAISSFILIIFLIVLGWFMLGSVMIGGLAVV